MLKEIHRPTEMNVAIEGRQFVEPIRTAECYVWRCSDEPFEVGKFFGEGRPAILICKSCQPREPPS